MWLNVRFSVLCILLLLSGFFCVFSVMNVVMNVGVCMIFSVFLFFVVSMFCGFGDSVIWYLLVFIFCRCIDGLGVIV